MVENIQPVEPGRSLPKPAPVPTEGGERSFREILEDSLESVNRLQQQADLTLERLYRNEATSEEVMIAFKKAQLAFETLMQIRNKLVDAFEEIQRMRI